MEISARKNSEARSMQGEKDSERLALNLGYLPRTLTRAEWRDSIKLEESYLLQALYKTRDNEEVRNLGTALSCLNYLGQLVEGSTLSISKKGIKDLASYLRIREGLQFAYPDSSSLPMAQEFAVIGAYLAIASGPIVSSQEERALLKIALNDLLPTINLALSQRAQNPPRPQMEAKYQESYQSGLEKLKRILQQDVGTDLITSGEKSVLFQLLHGAKRKLFLDQLDRLPSSGLSPDEVVHRIYDSYIDVERGGRIRIGDIEKLSAFVILGNNIDPLPFEKMHAKYLGKREFDGSLRLDLLSPNGRLVISQIMQLHKEAYSESIDINDYASIIEAGVAVTYFDRIIRMINGERVKFSVKEIPKLFELLDGVARRGATLTQEELESAAGLVQEGEISQHALHYLVGVSLIQLKASMLLELGLLMETNKERLGYIELLSKMIALNNRHLKGGMKYENEVRKNLEEYGAALDKLLIKARDGKAQEFTHKELLSLCLSFYERKLSLLDAGNSHPELGHLVNLEELDRLFALAALRF
ncbi:MAG: hypothetical protein KGH71_04225 [Candidatus Micrarchaeota archaeon]|nr:hypothetical protein [Candidatus Micrarchaeota archaeon]